MKFEWVKNLNLYLHTYRWPFSVLKIGHSAQNFCKLFLNRTASHFLNWNVFSKCAKIDVSGSRFSFNQDFETVIPWMLITFHLKKNYFFYVNYLLGLSFAIFSELPWILVSSPFSLTNTDLFWGCFYRPRTTSHLTFLRFRKCIVPVKRKRHK